MKKIGFNMEKVKVNNSASILRLLNQKGPMSRKDIAAELGLTSAAVTILCNDMIEQNSIISIGEVVEKNRSGRKKVLIDINYQNKTIVSVSIQPIHTFIYLCDIKGNPLDKIILKTNSKKNPIIFLHEIEDQIRVILNQAKVDWEAVLGIGVTITGIVDSEQGISLHAYGIWEEEVPIKAILEERLNAHVTVGNNVKAFAEAELIYGARRTNDHILFVKWGPGVGSSIAIRNNTYEGKDFMAGELGHYVVDMNGDKCRCGRRGCLETIVSYQSIVERIREKFTVGQMPELYNTVKGDISLLETEIIENNKLDYLLECKDMVVIEIIRECIEVLSHVVVNAMTILAPNQVIMLSPVFDKERYFHYFMECCKQLDHNINEELIKKSKLENAINYIGGVAISANQDFFNCGGFDNRKEDVQYENNRIIATRETN